MPLNLGYLRDKFSTFSTNMGFSTFLSENFAKFSKNRGLWVNFSQNRGLQVTVVNLSKIWGLWVTAVLKIGAFTGCIRDAPPKWECPPGVLVPA